MGEGGWEREGKGEREADMAHVEVRGNVACGYRGRSK
jgi:hypothetical protein